LKVNNGLQKGGKNPVESGHVLISDFNLEKALRSFEKNCKKNLNHLLGYYLNLENNCSLQNHFQLLCYHPIISGCVVQITDNKYTTNTSINKYSASYLTNLRTEREDLLHLTKTDSSQALQVAYLQKAPVKGANVEQNKCNLISYTLPSSCSGLNNRLTNAL
jgi:hypothetical protein